MAKDFATASAASLSMALVLVMVSVSPGEEDFGTAPKETLFASRGSIFRRSTAETSKKIQRTKQAPKWSDLIKLAKIS